MKKAKLKLTPLKYRGLLQPVLKTYFNELENQKEIDEFLDQWLTKIGPKRQKNLKWQLISNIIGVIIKTLPVKKSQEHERFVAKFYQNFRKE